jgi:aspartyl/asparaginyl beta-hydroxylase (cupin superfamily)
MPPQSIADPRVLQLVQSAHETMRSGRLEESVRIWEQVRALAPDHPQALFHLGCYFLYRKEAARARQLLEQAARADPTAAAIPLNLSHAYRALGDNTGELAAITRALTIDPYFFPALMAKAMLIERVGTSRAAAKAYKTALAIAPPDEEMPPDLRSVAAHARERVRDNGIALEQFLETRLTAVRGRHKGAKLDRFDQCKDIALGARKVFTQQPSMLLVPGLPAIQFYDDSEFPWLAKLEAATDAIREELIAVMQTQKDGFQPYVAHPDGAPINQWKELNHSPRWSTYFLWKNGKRFDDACASCPRTAAASEAIPVIDAENFGPTIMFSVLAPHTHIPPHSSVTNARLVVHLPIIVPQGCRFRVGNETRDWRAGKAWVFDDTIEHEAWNDSDEYRIILMIDIWNPLLSVAERELVTTLLNGLNAYYSD